MKLTVIKDYAGCLFAVACIGHVSKSDFLGKITEALIDAGFEYEMKEWEEFTLEDIHYKYLTYANIDMDNPSFNYDLGIEFLEKEELVRQGVPVTVFYENVEY